MRAEPDTTATDPQYLLDTNILLALARHGPLGERILRGYPLLITPVAPLVSYVAEAEVRSIAARNHWGATRMEQVEFLLTLFTRVPIESPAIMNSYVIIDVFSHETGIGMGKNDLWIAATASATGATLLTTDRDFDHLNGLYLAVEWIDPA